MIVRTPGDVVDTTILDGKVAISASSRLAHHGRDYLGAGAIAAGSRGVARSVVPGVDDDRQR
jgi:hypothetical protein